MPWDEDDEGKGNGVWVRGRWFPRRRPPTEKELARARAEMAAPIQEEARVVQGYRCDACEYWFQDRREGLAFGRDAWLLRYGCPVCGDKELTACSAIYCTRCGGLVPTGDEHEHALVCE